MGKLIRAAIYCRVSTEFQAVKGYSLEEQNIICSAYIYEKGYVFVERVSEEISGTTFNRPKMDKLIKLAKDKLIDVVVVQELDRFARGVTATTILEQQLKQHGVRVEYVLNNFEDSPMGDFMKTVQSGAAEYERTQILRRMANGKNGKARSGKVVQSPNTTYGYCFENDAYHILEEEAQVVRNIYKWYVEEGIGYVQIANRLTQQGIPTRSDNSLSAARRTKATGMWNMSTIRNILSNRVYIGEYQWGKERIVVPVPLIIERHVFDAVQEQKKLNIRFNRRNASLEYLLTGMLYCKTCGERFYGLTKNKDSSIRYYRCGSQVPDHKPYPGYVSGCSKAYIKADQIEQIVWDTVVEAIQEPERITGDLRRKQQELAESAATQDGQIHALQMQIEKISQQEKRLLNLYLDNKFDTEVLRQKGDELKAIRIKLEADVEILNNLKATEVMSDEGLAAFEDYCHKIKEGMRFYSPQQKKATLKLLRTRVILDKRDGSMEITGLAGDLSASYLGYMQYCLIPKSF